MTTDRNLSAVSNSERPAAPEVRCVQHANAPAEGSDGSHSVTRPLAALALPRQPGSQAGPRRGGPLTEPSLVFRVPLLAPWVSVTGAG